MEQLLQDKKFMVYEAIKWASCIIAIIFIASMLSSGKKSNTPFEKMSTAVKESVDLTTMKEADSQMIKRLYSISPDDYEGVILYYPTSNMGAEELLLVKLKDISQQNTVVESINSRIASQKKSFDGYGVEQFAMLENAKVEVEGNYILFISSTHPNDTTKAFNKNL